MRKLSIILILFVTISFYSCNEDKENLYGQIVGHWDLVSLRTYFKIDLYNTFNTYFHISDSLTYQLDHMDYIKVLNFKENGFLDIEHYPSGIDKYRWSIRKNTLIINEESCEIYKLTKTEFHFKKIYGPNFDEYELVRK